MNYRNKKWQFWKKKLDLSYDILEKLYNSKLTAKEYIAYGLMGKIPFEKCVESKYNKLAKIVGTEELFKLDWSLINDANLPIIEEIASFLVKEKIDKPLMDAIYEKIYEQILNPEGFYLGKKQSLNNFFYSEDMSENFKKRYPELFLEQADLPDKIKSDFYNGTLKIDDFLKYWDIFKNKNIGRTLKYNLNTNESFYKFIKEHGALAQTLFKYLNYYGISTIKEYYNVSNEEELKRIITNDIQKAIIKAHSNNSNDDISNDEMMIYLNYLNLADIYPKLNPNVIERVEQLGIEKLLKSSIPFESILRFESILKVIEEFGIENVDEFNKSSEGFLINNHCQVMHEIHGNYFENGILNNNIAIASHDGEHKERYSKEDFNNIIRNMIINTPQNYKHYNRDGQLISNTVFSGEAFNYSGIKGKFRQINTDLFIDEENVPEEFKKAFYTKRLTADLINQHKEVLPILKSKYFQNRFTDININVEKYNNYGKVETLRSIVPFLLEEFGYEKAMEIIANYQQDNNPFYNLNLNCNGDVNKPIEDLMYEIAYETFIKSNRRSFANNALTYPENASSAFKNRFPNLFLDNEDLPEEVKQDFYKGKLKPIDFAAYFSVFKNKDITRTLTQKYGRVDFAQILEANNRFVSEYGELARVLYKTEDYLLAVDFYSKKDETKRWQVIDEAIKKQTEEQYRRQNQKFVSNEDFKIYLKCQSINKFFQDSVINRVGSDYYSDTAEIQEVAAVIKRYGIDNILASSIPIDLILTNKAVMSFVREFGIEQIDAFNKESNDFFAANDCEMLRHYASYFKQLQNLIDNPGVYIKGKIFDYQPKKYTKTEFYEAVKKLSLHGGFNYRAIEGSFKKVYPEMFVSEDAPAEFADCVYNRHLNISFLEDNPEYLEFIQGLDLRLLYNCSPQVLETIQNAFGNEKGWEIVLSYNTHDLLFISQIIEKKFNNEMTLEAKMAMITQEEIDIQKELHNILDNGYYTYNNSDNLKKHYPELFLPEKVPENIKKVLEEKLLNRRITPEFLAENPEYLQYLKDVDVQSIFRPISVEFRNPNTYIAKSKEVNIVSYLKDILGNEATLLLLTQYYKYFYDACRSNVSVDFSFDMKPAEVVAQLKKVIYIGIKDKNIPYDDNLPEDFKNEYSNLFLPANTPDNIKQELGLLLYKRNLTPNALYNHPEYLPYLKDVDISVAIQPMEVSVSLNDGTNKRKDVNLVPYFKKVFGNDEALKVLSSYGKYLYDIHYDYSHRHNSHTTQFVNLMVSYAKVMDRSPMQVTGPPSDFPPELMKFLHKMGAEEVLRHMKNLVYAGIKDMRLAYDEKMPVEFKEEHPDLFLPTNIPDDIKGKINELFYNRRLTTEFLTTNPEFIEYFQGIDASILFEPIKSIILTNDKSQRYYEPSDLIEYFKSILGNDLTLNLMFMYGKYLNRIYQKNTYQSPLNRQFHLDMAPEEIVAKLNEVIHKGILESHIIYDKDLPQQFKDSYPNLFLPQGVSPDIEQKFYDRTLSLEDFDLHPEIMQYFDNINIGYYLDSRFSWLGHLFNDKENPNAVRLKTASEYARIKVDTLQDRFRSYVQKNIDIITEENILQLSELLYKLSYSNSSELSAFSSELADQLLLEKDPLQLLNEIEGVFLRNNLPTVGKVFSVFQLRYPDFKGLNLKSERMSPVLKKNASKTRGNIRMNDLIIFNDLIKASFGSNNRSILEYLEGIEKGTKIFSQIKSGQITISELDDENLKVLQEFGAHLNTMYNNTQAGRINPRVISGNIENDINELLNLFVTNNSNVEDLPDRLIRMFCGGAGFRTFKEAKEYIKEKAKSADLRNRQTTQRGFTLETGDFIKGVGEVTYLKNIFQNGSVAREFLGASSASDATPLDTDLAIVLKAKDDICETISSTIASEFGPIFFIIKNDERVAVTRRSSAEENQTVDEKVSLNKLEAFYTGAFGNGEHYGIRTGFASSEVDYIVTLNEDLRIGFEIAKNGFYIPVINANGDLIFSPKDYDDLRAKMTGLSYYRTGEYEFAENLMTSDVAKIASNLPKAMGRVSQIRQQILKHFSTAITKSGMHIKTQIDGDLTEGFVEVIDTGSTGRGTCMANDIDFDFALRLDRKIMADPILMETLENNLLEAVGKAGTSKTNGRYILNDVIIDGVSEPLKVDISFYERTDKIAYSTDMALNDRLKTIAKQSLEKYQMVLANIILAKNVLKKANVYKAFRSDNTQGGLGGVGVENWILQNGGSFEQAARRFLEASENRSFNEFKQAYHVWDFGANHESEKKGIYPHDNFVWNNMSEVGYDKMKKSLAEYLYKLYPNEMGRYAWMFEEEFKIEEMERVDFGTSEMYQCTDASGKTYLFKPAVKKGTAKSQAFRAYIQEAAYKLQRIIDPESAIFCKATVVNNMFGAIQEKIEVNDTPYLLTNDETLTVQLLREFVTDYLLCNHDGYARNFILGTDGILRGIDKEQSMKYIDCDPENISIDYNPNGEITVYNELFNKYRKGLIKLDLDTINKYIDLIDKVDDTTYLSIFHKYVSTYAKDSIEKKKLYEQIQKRKTNLKETMMKFIDTLKKDREQTLTLQNTENIINKITI